MAVYISWPATQPIGGGLRDAACSLPDLLSTPTKNISASFISNPHYTQLPSCSSPPSLPSGPPLSQPYWKNRRDGARPKALSLQELKGMVQRLQSRTSKRKRNPVTPQLTGDISLALPPPPPPAAHLNAVLTYQIKLTTSWQAAFSLWMEFSDLFNALNLTALIHHMACLVPDHLLAAGRARQARAGGAGAAVTQSSSQQGQRGMRGSSSPLTMMAGGVEAGHELACAVQELREFAEEEAHNCRPRELATISYGLAKLGALSRRWVQLMMGRVRPARFNNQELCITVWALAVGGWVPDNPEWQRALLAELLFRRTRLLHKELVIALWALAKLGVHPGKQWLESMVEELGRRSTGLNSQDLANSLWALARFQYTPRPGSPAGPPPPSPHPPPSQPATLDTTPGRHPPPPLPPLPTPALPGRGGCRPGGGAPPPLPPALAGLGDDQPGAWPPPPLPSPPAPHGWPPPAAGSAPPPPGHSQQPSAPLPGALAQLVQASLERCQEASGQQLCCMLWAVAVGGWTTPRAWVEGVVGELVARARPGGRQGGGRGGREAGGRVDPREGQGEGSSGQLGGGDWPGPGGGGGGGGEAWGSKGSEGAVLPPSTSVGLPLPLTVHALPSRTLRPPPRPPLSSLPIPAVTAQHSRESCHLAQQQQQQQQEQQQQQQEQEQQQQQQEQGHEHHPFLPQCKPLPSPLPFLHPHPVAAPAAAAAAAAAAPLAQHTWQHSHSQATGSQTLPPPPPAQAQLPSSRSPRTPPVMQTSVMQTSSMQHAAMHHTAMQGPCMAANPVPAMTGHPHAHGTRIMRDAGQGQGPSLLPGHAAVALHSLGLRRALLHSSVVGQLVGVVLAGCDVTQAITAAAGVRAAAGARARAGEASGAAAGAAAGAVRREAASCSTATGPAEGAARQQGGRGTGPLDLMCTLWALARLDFNPGPHVMRQLLDSFHHQLPTAYPQEVAGVLWAAAKLGCDPPPELSEGLVSSMLRRLDQFGPSELSNCLWALAKLRHRLSGRALYVIMGALAAFQPHSPRSSSRSGGGSRARSMNKSSSSSSGRGDAGMGRRGVGQGGAGGVRAARVKGRKVCCSGGRLALVRLVHLSAPQPPTSPPSATPGHVRPSGTAVLLNHQHIANSLWSLAWLLPPGKRYAFGHVSRGVLCQLEHASLGFMQAQLARVQGAKVEAVGLGGAWRSGRSGGAPGAAQAVVQLQELLQTSTAFAALGYVPDPEWVVVHQSLTAQAGSCLTEQEQRRLQRCYRLLTKGPDRKLVRPALTSTMPVAAQLLPAA